MGSPKQGTLGLNLVSVLENSLGNQMWNFLASEDLNRGFLKKKKYCGAYLSCMLLLQPEAGDERSRTWIRGLQNIVLVWSWPSDFRDLKLNFLRVHFYCNSLLDESKFTGVSFGEPSENFFAIHTSLFSFHIHFPWTKVSPSTICNINI